jgi:hypothetical protein
LEWKNKEKVKSDKLIALASKLGHRFDIKILLTVYSYSDQHSFEESKDDKYPEFQKFPACDSPNSKTQQDSDEWNMVKKRPKRRGAGGKDSLKDIL